MFSATEYGAYVVRAMRFSDGTAAVAATSPGDVRNWIQLRG